MSYYIEKALSSKSKCVSCNEKINRDEVRLVFEGRGYNYPIKRNYCKKCGKKIVLEEIKKLNDILKEWLKEAKKFLKE